MRFIFVVTLIFFFIVGPMYLQWSFQEADKETTIHVIDSITEKRVSATVSTVPDLERKYSNVYGLSSGKGKYIFMVPNTTTYAYIKVSAEGYDTKRVLRVLDPDGEITIMLEKSEE